jgi:type II secretory pathway pseudopilin PulG
MIRGRQKLKGATLIEVGVVVTTFGFFVALFAPTLPGVREQARIARCLQNLRAIAQAAGGYIAEHETIVFTFSFYYYIDGRPTNHNLATEFVWGGGVPDKTRAEWDETQGYYNPPEARTDTYVITPANRPLNAYMSPGVWWSDPERVKGNTLRYFRPMLLPDYFQCPSDSSAHAPPIPGAEDPNLPESGDRWYPTWQWWGTSYAINWYWGGVYEYSGPPFWGLYGHVINAGKIRALFEEKNDRGASEFALFLENRLNFAFQGAAPRGYPSDEPWSLRGWHGERDVHAAGFLDGSARYQYFDTRYIDDAGWTIWPNRPWDGTYWEPYQDY